MSITENPYLFVAQKCFEHDISIHKMCKDIKVHETTIAKWRDNPPKTLEIINKIEEYFKKLEK